ncbi:3-carboxy-cis,cis-muconate cycloisomerase [Actinopolyspora xinjiangensis]|uniref:3-carboxy-cis,cis-muconate cycloisomerase n=1 Tax=Actinopolyspora xinjiangensis TaxID=405564 RepID=A0A1H0WN92_9ACTN|nr:3-carboxy-cis,cis-muconate cycloisomerase [Actinopolyspora xinjiangensis]SDP92127.1 3-carboxy-cis,cis-muconate cycloisomerase [Actinopolyspora xinjiangensis]
MRSETATGLFTPTFVTERFGESAGARAWLAAMLEFESALVLAQADVGLIPTRAAEEISRRCVVEEFDIDSIARRAAESATPVIPLVKDLTDRVDAEAARYVHRGATSQDVVDTAAMLVARDALRLSLDELRVVAGECARLAEEHRNTLMTGRTLLQQALPTTFGRKAAGWLTAVVEAAEGLDRVRSDRLAVQFGGPVGTLATLGSHGTRVAAALAGRLGLAEPTLPWHTDRTRVAELATSLGTVAGTLGNIALDIELGAQTEVGEFTEGRSGGSSAMPHKRNPVRAVRVTAAARRVPGLVASLLSAVPQEHERAAGAWQSEWEPFGELLRLVGSAASTTGEMLGELRVDEDRMRSNLELSGGLLLAERVSTALSEHIGPGRAAELVSELSGRVTRNGTTLRAELLVDETTRAVLSEREVVELTEPGDYLGSADEFVDRALAAYTSWKEKTTGDSGL